MGYVSFDTDAVKKHDGAQIEDRRASERTKTIFRPAIITYGSFRGLCLVRNISPTGMMAKVYSPVAVGTSVIVEFDSNLSVTGTAAWSENEQIGVRFNESVDVAGVLVETGKRGAGNKVNRPLRLEIEAHGEMEINKRILPFEVQDISQRGIKAKIPVNLNPNDEVMIQVIGLEPRLAVVRWTRPGEAGLNFTRPLRLDELAMWVAHKQTG